MIEILPPLEKYKYNTWKILPVKCYIDNFICLWSCIQNIMSKPTTMIRSFVVLISKWRTCQCSTSPGVFLLVSYLYFPKRQLQNARGYEKRPPIKKEATTKCKGLIKRPPTKKEATQNAGG
jgi:hypothetical protein